MAGKCVGGICANLTMESNMKCVETWPLPAESWAAFGPAARPKAGPDQETELQALPQPNVSSVATRGPSRCFSLLIKGVTFMPAALALQPPISEQKPEGGEEEEGGRRRGEGEEAKKERRCKKE